MATSSAPVQLTEGTVARVRIVRDGYETSALFYSREDAEGALAAIATQWEEELGFTRVERDGSAVGTFNPGEPDPRYAEIIDL